MIANDLGKDKVYTYAYDKDSEHNVLVLKDSISIKPGSGPRHITFSSNGRFAYLIQEMIAQVTVFSYADGVFKRSRKYLLAKDFKAKMEALTSSLQLMESSYMQVTEVLPIKLLLSLLKVTVN
ncbi:hypothetical protein CS542_06160 [Pedobacter sp. IW39]|nr:hypothetical protein CS542_06160 [Pedobacter sp. IW39]